MPEKYLSYNYISVPRPSIIGDNFTFISWIKTTEVGFGVTHYQLMNVVLSQTPGTVNDLNFLGELCYGDGKIGNWTFVAVTREKTTGTIKMYVIMEILLVLVLF